MNNAFGRRSGFEQPRPPWGDEITPLTEVCGGRYVLLHEIARGGHSIVYRAKPAGERDPVAFKVLQPRYIDDEARVRRFRREAELLRKIEHPNLVRLLDHGTIEDGRDYIALELLVGRTLADALANNRRMTPERTSRIVRQIARALRAMHRAGVIHRDLQPQNILLIGPEDGERVKLVDFAKAGDVGAPARRVKQTMHADSGGQGELDYRAPEQRRKRPPQPSMDVFSLGVIAYQMLSGEHPFTASSTESMPRLGPHTIRTKAFDAPEALLGLVADCIEREPEDRPRSMDDVIEQLDKALLWMGVVPRGSAGTPMGDEDLRTQLYSAADEDSEEGPAVPRGVRESPRAQQPLLRERSPLMDELYEPIEEVLATEPRRPKLRRDAGRPTTDEMDAMPTARRRPEAEAEAAEPEPTPRSRRGAAGPRGAKGHDGATEDLSPPPNLDTDELDGTDQDGRAVVVDTVAWTKPEPSADSNPPQRGARVSRVATDSDQTRRRVPPPPQALPRWLVPLLSGVLVVLAYAVWVVWTK